MWRWTDVLGLMFAVALVYVLVRPGSKAGLLVEACANLIVSMIRSATDLASPQA